MIYQPAHKIVSVCFTPHHLSAGLALAEARYTVSASGQAVNRV